jgi:hypothetical protein
MSQSVGWRRMSWQALAGAIVAAVALTLASVMAASAAVPNSSTGLINACYRTSGGALRVIDAQAGQACQTGERALNWPAAGVAATEYSTTAPVNLPHDAGLQTMVVTGPVLPPGTWNISMSAILINGTGRPDAVRCGLYNGGGGLIRGNATTVTSQGYESISVPALVTLPTADRINVECAHDSALPAGVLQVYFATVVAQKVASRF